MTPMPAHCFRPSPPDAGARIAGFRKIPFDRPRTPA